MQKFIPTKTDFIDLEIKYKQDEIASNIVEQSYFACHRSGFYPYFVKPTFYNESEIVDLEIKYKDNDELLNLIKIIKDYVVDDYTGPYIEDEDEEDDS